jgi:hypothetical protein
MGAGLWQILDRVTGQAISVPMPSDTSVIKYIRSEHERILREIGDAAPMQAEPALAFAKS